MNETHLTYFDAPYLYQSAAKVVSVDTAADGLTDVVLDATIFYPQGGGQPFDFGLIKSLNGELAVTAVRYVEGVVHHFGQLAGVLKVGESVDCSVDRDRRELNSRYHSGGHIIDFALSNLGYEWVPHKGHHYPNEAYDEYVGVLNGEDPLAILPKLQAEVDRLIQKGPSVTMQIMSRDELQKLCRFVPAQLPAGKPTRGAIVHFEPSEGGDRGIPCGGTHVPNFSFLEGMKIRKIKGKNGMIKVSYGW